MPPRETELPEGTDHIINGAMETRDRIGKGVSEEGFVGNRRGDIADDSGGTMVKRNDGSVRGQLLEGMSSLKQDATDRVRQFADEGKGRASDVLDELSRIVDDAADSIDKSLGNQYGGYARSAAHAVSGFATTLRARNVDELYGDARDMVRKSPVIAIGAAAAAGFALVRLVKAGLPQEIDAPEGADANPKTSKRKKRSRTDA